MSNPHKNREKRGDARKTAAQSSSFTGMDGDRVQRESQQTQVKTDQPELV